MPLPNPLKQICLKLIRFYQTAISPYTPPHCRFYPTCSAYAFQAINRFGVLRGGFLAAKRILRCNPLFPGGYDPVPEEFSLFRKKPSSPPGKTE